MPSSYSLPTEEVATASGLPKISVVMMTVNTCDNTKRITILAVEIRTIVILIVIANKEPLGGMSHTEALMLLGIHSLEKRMQAGNLVHLDSP